MTDSPPSSSTIHLTGKTLAVTRIAGGILVGFSLLLFVLALPAHTDHLVSIYSPEQLTQLHLPPSFFAWYVLPFDIAFEVIFAIIAGVIFWRRSHDPMALFISVTLILIAVSFPSAVATFAQSEPIWQLPVALIKLLSDIFALMALYIFPNFRFVPSWSRWLALGGMIWILLDHLLSSPFVLANFLIYLALFASGAWTQIYRYRNSADMLQRQQTKWIVFGISIAIVGTYLCDLPFSLYPDAFATVPGLVYNLFRIPLRLIFAALIPLSIAFSVLRYRLWNIDFVINRSLVYGALTVLLLALLGGSLFLISRLFQNFSGGPLLAVAISSAIFGAIFQPARRHLQRFVDQRFYNIQIDYQKTPPPGLDEQMPGLPHTRFGDYQNLELIGRGGMGEVYKAIHPTSGQPIAIKILPASLATDADFRRRFEREVRVIALLQHPNIIRLLDSGTDDETPYMVMEYLAGKDLSVYLRERGRLTLDEAQQILRDIASGLDFAHAQGLVHRDIKPSNMMLDADRAVLMDFGIAKLLGRQTALTRTGILGTLDYIAPEQIQASAEVDGRADVYAFGVVVYQTLTGELPFQNQNPGALLMAHLFQPPPDPRDLAPDLPKTAASAIQRAMAKLPEERFATAREFIHALTG